jgi:DNA-binding NarL/FixJ family response regulator
MSPVIDVHSIARQLLAAMRETSGLSIELRRDLAALVRQVAALLDQLDTTDELASLTPRQLEVALLTARGCTNGEIARVLALSENTIKKHLKDVYAVLEITNRTELATIVAQRSQGLV